MVQRCSLSHKLFFILEKFRKIMAKKTVLLRLESTAGTGYFYVRDKNPKKLTKKLEFKKYDPIARKHVLFVEKKMK